MICAFYAAEVKMRKLVLGSWQLRSVKRSGNNGAQVRCRTGDSNDLVEALLGGKKQQDFMSTVLHLGPQWPREHTMR